MSRSFSLDGLIHDFYATFSYMLYISHSFFLCIIHITTTRTQVELIDSHYIGDSGLHELVWWRNHLSSLATCIGLNLQLKGVEKPLKHKLANEFSEVA